MQIRDLMMGDVTRLRNVIRFNNCQRQHDESVAEHTFYVTFYAMVLADWFESEYHPIPSINHTQLLKMCILHDFEESISGDIPRNFKHFRPELRDQLHSAASTIFDRVVKHLQSSAMYKMFWRKQKDNTLEGLILGLADFMATVSYISLEVDRGNVAILRDTSDVLENMNRFHDSPAYDPFKPITTELAEFVYGIYKA